jgi:hypothetical protein
LGEDDILSVFSVSNNTGVSFSMLHASSPYAFYAKLRGILPKSAALCNIRIGIVPFNQLLSKKKTKIPHTLSIYYDMMMKMNVYCC